MNIYCHSVINHRYCEDSSSEVLPVLQLQQKIMNNTSTILTGRTEVHYLTGDLTPIGISFLIGIGIIGCLVLCRCRKCKNNGNVLIVWLYGGHLTRVEGGVNEEKVLYIDDNKVGETKELKRLRFFLLVNAVTLATLLTMIFWDNFIVKSYFNSGCLPNLDCYVANITYTKSPINCSDYFNRDEQIVCYEFILDFFQSFADTGGILIVATLGVALMTKLWIYCCPQNVNTRRNWWGLHLCKICFLVVLLVPTTVALYFIHKNTHESYSFLRDIGHVLKFLAVIFSIFITTFSPWHVLINVDPVINARLNVNAVLENNSLMVNPAPDVNPVLNVTGQLDGNPILNVNKALNVRFVLKVKGDFNVDPNQVLEVKGELNINFENPVVNVLNVSGELNVTGNLTVNNELNTNPVLTVSGQLNVNPVLEVTGILNVKTILKITGQLNVSHVEAINTH